jgi:phospholipase/lecithinase/hemolysin
MTHHTTFALTTLATALLTGCASSGGSGASAVTSPFSADGSSALGSVHVNTMRVFGDSYSDPSFTSSLGSSNWSQLLVGKGLVTTNANYAIGGARASSGEVRAFDQQLNTALGNGTGIADGDLSVVYLGYNDIGRTGSPDGLAKATAGYKAGIARLVAAGAANENRRIFVTQLTNWSRGPGVSDGTEQQVIAWNNTLAGIANENANIIAVDMYTAFERVFEAPAAYGFTNVTTAGGSSSATTSLFSDTIHYGSRGQEIISRVYQHYLTRGWDWANSVSAGSDSAAQLSADIDAGTLILGYGQGNNAEQPLQSGFRLLPLGVSETSALSPSTSQTSQVFRPFSQQASFAQSAPSGLALDFGLGNAGTLSDGRLGMAVFQYQQAKSLTSAQDRQARQYTSNALSAYWHQPVAGLMFTSQVSHLNLNFANQTQDEYINLNLQNESQGDTWSMVNKLRYPMQSGGLNFTPWVSLTGQSHNLDAAQFSSPYTTDVKYSSSRMNELLTGVGVDVQTSPVFLNGGSRLLFGGSLHHTSSLYRDAITVSMEESGTPGVVQSEIFQSPQINTTTLNLQANMILNKQTRFSATYGTELQDVKDTSSLALLAHFNF